MTVLLSREAIFECVKWIMRPVVRYCLRNSIKLQELFEATKIVFVEEAKEALTKSKIKFNDSKISVMTGVHRRDLSRFRESDMSPKQINNAVFKLLGLWQSSKKYLLEGKPKKLSYGSDGSDFSKLVRSITSDIHPQAVLTELTRCGAVRLDNGEAVLIAKIYNPKGDYKKGFQIISSDCNDLISAVEENVIDQIDPPNHHVRTAYDNVYLDDPDKIRSWILSKGDKFHEEMRNHISKHDLDIDPDQNTENKSKYRVVVGSFSWIEKIDEDDK